MLTKDASCFALEYVTLHMLHVIMLIVATLPPLIAVCCLCFPGPGMSPDGSLSPGSGGGTVRSMGSGVTTNGAVPYNTPPRVSSHGKIQFRSYLEQCDLGGKIYVMLLCWQQWVMLSFFEVSQYSTDDKEVFASVLD